MSEELLMHCGDDEISDVIEERLTSALKGTTLKIAVRYQDAHPCIFIGRKDKKPMTKSDKQIVDCFKLGYNAALKAKDLYADLDAGRRQAVFRRQ